MESKSPVDNVSSNLCSENTYTEPLEQPVIPSESNISEGIQSNTEDVSSDVSRSVASVGGKEFYYYESFYYESSIPHLPSKLTKEEQLYIYELCQEYELEYEIILALMGVETGWNLHIGEVNGYIGIGMLSKYWFTKDYGYLGIDLNDPLGSAEGVCVVMASKLDTYDNNYHMALTAYNRGNTGAETSHFNYGIYESKFSRKVFAYRDAMLESVLENHQCINERSRINVS